MERTTKTFRKRNAILSCLKESTVHPSAEWVYNRLKSEYPDISLATVYRNLNLFKQQGLISSVGTVQGVERFDSITAPHVHFICTRCGSVMDLTEIEIPQELSDEASRCSGGAVTGCRLTFTGLCQTCSALSEKMEVS